MGAFMAGSSTYFDDSKKTDRERLMEALSEVDRLRGDLAKRHTLDFVEVIGRMTTTTGGGTLVESKSFRLDGAVIQPKWNKSGLRVGCHTVTREALEALAKLEE